MCGIAGIYSPRGAQPDGEVLKRMTRVQSHRGPDDEGYLVEPGIGLGQRRLSIIDLSAAGRQPIPNEDKTIWTVFNGEIFNYVELREVLEKKGHRFYTHTDTEVIVHAYEEYGDAFVEHLNGQFAIAVWDKPRRRLLLTRDRVGIRPLFHATLPDGTLLFGSEMKALFKHPGLKAEMDPVGVNQVFTFWVNVPPRTVFKGVEELAAGSTMVVDASGRKLSRYWRHRFPDRGDYEDKPLSHWTEKLREILADATTLQLRADVPVAAYLSGGIDSSVLSALVKKHHNPGLVTFSVAFSDPAYDESSYQKQMVDFLGTDHRMIKVDHASIGQVFPQVVSLAEKPMIRTAPAPLFSLAGLVRQNGIKVVLTGEGSDEIFGGYNIFREDKVRRFWARNPESKFRPALLSRLYPYINKNAAGQAFWRAFFKKGLTDTENPYYSHLIRWGNTAQIQNLYTSDFKAAAGPWEAGIAEVDAFVEPDMMRWDPLCRAQYLEMSLFMSGYLLSSQGDRMMMGQSIEGRFPFLDHRLVEFAATIPPKYKVRILEEKHILKRAYEDLIPPAIVNRPKQPYRAPVSACFLEGDTLAASMLDDGTVKKYGYFDPDAVKNLLAKIRKNTSGAGSAREDMAVVGIVSLHLLHREFVEASGAAG